MSGFEKMKGREIINTRGRKQSRAEPEPLGQFANLVSGLEEMSHLSAVFSCATLNQCICVHLAMPTKQMSQRLITSTTLLQYFLLWFLAALLDGKDSWHWSQQMKASASPPSSCGFKTPLEA